METQRMIELVSELGRVKSAQNAAAAVLLQHEDMVLEVPAMGAHVTGRAGNEKVLTGFFKAFPDYGVTLEGFARAGEDELVAWGEVRMTLSTDRYGVTPNGKPAIFPAFFRFRFKDDLISREYFLWDLAEVCSQWGVSTDAMRAALFAPRKQAAAA
jgi:predicted ester cyclase